MKKRKKKFFSKFFSVLALFAVLLSIFTINASAVSQDNLVLVDEFRYNTTFSSNGDISVDIGDTSKGAQVDLGGYLLDILNTNCFSDNATEQSNTLFYSISILNHETQTFKRLGLYDISYLSVGRPNISMPGGNLRVKHFLRSKTGGFSINIYYDSGTTANLGASPFIYDHYGYDLVDFKISVYQMTDSSETQFYKDLLQWEREWNSTLLSVQEELNNEINSLKYEILLKQDKIRELSLKVSYLEQGVANDGVIRDLFNGIADGTMGLVSPILSLSVGSWSLGNILSICIVAFVAFILLKAFRG